MGKRCRAGSKQAGHPVPEAGRAGLSDRDRGPLLAHQSPGHLPPAAFTTSPLRRAPSGPLEAAIVAVARANPTDGYRMVTALLRRRLGLAVNRRRRRPGHFTVSRPHQLWHLDMTAIWVAEHGWCYLNAAIDCCTRRITAWSLDLRAWAAVAERLIAGAVFELGIRAGQLTLGTDNGSAFTARRFRAALAGLGIAHRRGGYRDPQSQAFIESWFAKLKEREVWRSEYETPGAGASGHRRLHRTLP